MKTFGSPVQEESACDQDVPRVEAKYSQIRQASSKVLVSRHSPVTVVLPFRLEPLGMQK